MFYSLSYYSVIVPSLCYAMHKVTSVGQVAYCICLLVIQLFEFKRAKFPRHARLARRIVITVQVMSMVHVGNYFCNVLRNNCCERTVIDPRSCLFGSVDA